MIVLAGASASGKTEVAKELAKKYGITKVITTTTRDMRVNEVNGRDYFFVSKEEFERMVHDGCFVEYTVFNENLYGRQLYVDFVSFIRPVKQFDSLEELRDQLLKDEEKTKNTLQ